MKSAPSRVLLIVVISIISFLTLTGVAPRADRQAGSILSRRENPVASSDGASGRTQHLSSPDQTPEGLNHGDWAGIRQSYEAGRRKMFERGPGEWTARNPRQQMAAEFNGRGAKLATDGGTPLGLKLAGYGFSDRTISVGAKARRVTARENRIAYEWDDRLTEWFVNDERGFEQGWTLASAPDGTTSARIEVGVTGGFRVNTADATTVNLTNGATALTYGGLKAWDATGKTLNARFEAVTGNRIGVTVETAGAVYPVTVDPWVQQAYLKASNTGATDQFGQSVAVSGDTVVVGADQESSAATGINGNQADNSAVQSGAAYVFVRSGGVWSQQAYLKASNTGAGDFFGLSVAVSGDTVVVGAWQEDSAATGVNGNQADNSASRSGAAYVFTRTGTTWSQQAYLKASNTGVDDLFGVSVAVSGDTVVVGAFGESSAATGVNGNQADNSVVNSGAAYVFVRSGTMWSQQAYLKASNTGASDLFGASVGVSGDTVVVGAYWESSAATGVNGNQADNSATNAGAAYVFVRNGTTWSQQAYLKASNTDPFDLFGSAVAVSGDTVVVGALLENSNATGVNGNQADNSAIDSGAAYVFIRNGTTWTQQAYLKASNTGVSDQFGVSVAVSGDTVVVGAALEDSAATGVNGNQADNSASNSGAVYVFVRSGSVWSQQAYLKASNTGSDDYFGFSVAVAGDTVVVGAIQESSSATGVNGNQADNSAIRAGAVYTFVLGESVLSIDRAGANPTCSGGAVAWTVTFSGPVAGLTAANFSLVPVGVTGATITGVTGGPTVWTVTATTGTGAGSLGLNLANATGVTPTMTNLPFTGQVYTVAALPTAFNVTGGGNICAGNSAAVGLSGSQTGVNYQLFNGASPVGSPVAGTGSAISFGNQSTAGNYTVTATNAATGCTANMTGSATVTVNALPTAFNVTGGGTVCAGGPGVAIGLSSSQTGVSYQLFRGASPVGNPVVGTGSAISFGSQTTAGTYTVLATNTVTACMNTMTGNAVVTVVSLVVTNGNDSGAGSLRQVIADACVGSTITFQAGVTTVTLTSGELVINKNLTIQGPGANQLTVTRDSGASDFRIFSIPSAAVVNLSGLTISNGRSDSGSGLRAISSTLTLTGCVFTGNTAVGGVGGTGGGVLLSNSDGQFTDCTFSSNSGGLGGGGIYFTQSTPRTLRVVNCTFANNSSGGGGSGGGGGIFHFANNATSTLDVINCTFVNNSTGSGGTGGGIGTVTQGSGGVATTRLQNTLFSGNTTSLAINSGFGGTPVVTSLGNNLASDNGGGFLAASGDLVNANARLAPLANYGGPTPTCALLPGSPAINAGSGCVLTANGCGNNNPAVATDQRGIARVGNVDIGAFESRGFTMALSGGNNQSAPINTNFASPLAVTVSSAFSEPVDGGGVTFTPPGSGASASVAGNPATIASGTATTGTVTANGTVGGPYTVAASANGVTTGVNFSLTNACPTITAFSVTGGGPFCSGGTGVAVGLSGSQTGVNYQLFNGASPVGSPVAGTGSSLNFGNQTTAGTYTVVGTFGATGCTANMTGSAVVTVNPTPSIFNVTGGGSFCSGGTGVAVGLSGSQTGVNYQLFRGASPVGSPVAGTGSAISFGNQTTAGTYTVVATATTGSCTSNMTGSAVVTVNPLPAIFNVTGGGGTSCVGGSGVAVGLNGSETGVNYQLFNGASPVGSPVAGTGSAISFGNQTTAGTYTVVATNSTTGCTSNMSGSAVVTVVSAPTAFNVTGGGSFCAGSGGVAVGLSGSETGVNYQLFRGASPVGSPVAGTGSALNFGIQTTGGTYTVVGTNATAGCSTNMTGSAVVTVNPTPSIFNVTGGGSFCTGGTGVAVGLSGSETGVNYQLFNGASPMGSPVAGTGSALSFGNQTTAGTYTVVATATTGGCTSNMTGSAVVTVQTCQPTVTTNPATGVSSSGATLNGLVTANGNDTSVLFRYGTTAGGPYPNVIAATPSPVTGTTPTLVSATLTGLAADQVYYFVVEGSNTSGTSQGAEQSFSTATCNFSLSSPSASFPASGGNGSVTLTTTTGCVWTVSGIPTWISNVTPSNGTGTTAITYSVAPNYSETPRTATLTIGGQSYTVNQDPSVQVNGSIGLAITGQTVLPTSCSPNYANDYVITATVTNTGSQTIYNPHLRVLELQEAAGSPVPANPFRLLTADGATCGSGGLVGAIQSTDGQLTPATLPALAPGQSVTIRLVIALPNLRRFRLIFGFDGSFIAPVAMKGRASKAGFAKTFTLAKRTESSTGTAFVFIPNADGKTMNIVPVQPELEAFLNLGDDFWAGLNRTLLSQSGRAKR